MLAHDVRYRGTTGASVKRPLSGLKECATSYGGEGDEFIKEHSALLTAYRRQDWAAALRLLDDSRLAAALHLAPVY